MMGEHDDRKQRITEIFGGVMERDAAAALGSDLRSELPSGLSGLRGELVANRGELRNDVADVRKDVSDVRREVGDLRLEVHDGLAALRGQLPELLAARIASMVGVAVLVVDAVAL